MKILNQPIDMVAIFYSSGEIMPFKFKYQGKTVKIEEIKKIYQEKLADNDRIVFICKHTNRSLYELKFELESHKWFLFKK